jgi:chemotaxis protein CheX
MTDQTITTFELPATLDSTMAPRLLADLLPLRGKPLRVSGEAVNRVSTSCLQVLLSAAATWKADGMPFSITTPSATLLESTRLLSIGNEIIATD